MILSSGYPLWLISEGIPYNYPRLSKDIKSDVLIMGGGISGALVAFHLLKAGVHVTVVDRRTLGLGSTCASTSLLQYEIDTPLSKLKADIGEKSAIRAYELSVDSLSHLEKITKTIGYTDFEYKKSIHYAAFKKHIPFLFNEFEARRQMGLQVNWLDEAALHKRYGIIAPAAIISEPAAQTNAYTLTHALHQYNIKKGAKVYDRTSIVRIDQHTTGVSLVTEEGYKIHCKKLVHATGYETVEHIDKKIVRLSSTYAVASDQFNEENAYLKQGTLLWSTATPYLYSRATNDKRIIVGGRDEDFFSPRKRDALINKKSRQLVNDIQKLMPGIDFRQEFSWTGTFGSTKDGLPFIGRYNRFPHSLFALGFGGNGITFSVLAARMITDTITGKANKDASLFSFERV